MAGKFFKPSDKHWQIFKTITEYGYYKPSGSDREPATATLLKHGYVAWREDYRGVEFTHAGRKAYDELLRAQ